MKRKVIFIAAAMVVLLLAGWAQAEVCFIVNGSFEDDGWIDFPQQEPNGWDVNVPAGKFDGYVHQEWPTNGIYNLTLYPVRYATFEVNDMATVSQEVCLRDVNQIIFDVKLHTINFTEWDPNICTAVLLIDDDVVWESNSVGPDVRGEYYNQTYTVEDKYRVAGPNILSLGIRVNVAEMLMDFYMTQWDLVGCNFCCGDFGFLPEDFSYDCYVNFSDFAMLANYWLEEPPTTKYDLVEDGVIDGNDLKVFVDSCFSSSYEQGE